MRHYFKKKKRIKIEPFSGELRRHKEHFEAPFLKKQTTVASYSVSCFVLLLVSVANLAILPFKNVEEDITGNV
jgi:hypothetical protein